ncbi:hypothetical protein PLAN_100332 [Planktothrix rubescens CCAP 1459/22]|uniref:Uncharacterized protein n=1 Tax=Planktothrix rubescens CCAP 1459/22 TaxID=329571 RepID=A0A6J7ZD80_PLARU|nr:hypothetical protein PLAN_100332 [Planktothrix rubescens NIVA-CYA 18]
MCYSREHRNTGTPEQPPQTPRARGARGGGIWGETLHRLGSKIRLVS